MSENQIRIHEENPGAGSKMNVENTLNIQGLILNEEEPSPPKKQTTEIPKETIYDRPGPSRDNSRRESEKRELERLRDRERRHRERKRSREKQRSRERERRRREEQLKEGDSFEDLDDEDRKMMEELAHPEKKKNEKPPSNMFKAKNEDDNESAEEDDDYPPDFARDNKRHKRHGSSGSGSPINRRKPASPSYAWSPRKDFGDDSKWAYNEPDMSPEEELKKKQEILEGFDKLSRKGVRIHRVFDINSDLRDMEAEYNRLVRQREVENSIKFQRKMLMAFVTGVEFLNNRYNPFDLDLDGWSEVVNSDVDSYDDIFEELYEKYHTKVHMAPELRLMFTLGGSAIMFHLTNTMFKSALPGMNPEMAKGMQKMAMSAMRGGLGGGAGGNRGPPGPPGGFPAFPGFGGGPPGPGTANGPHGMSMPPRGPPPQRKRQSMPRSSRQIPQPGISTKRPSPKRREMRGPKNTDLDDILNDLNLPDEDIGTDIEALLQSDESEETKHISLKKKDGITLKGK